MDVKPTFGHQELFESLSQNGSASSTGSSDCFTVSGSSDMAEVMKSTDSSMKSGSHVDEAYRRLGCRLSSQAHGENNPGYGNIRQKAPIPRRLVTSRHCGFERYQRSTGKRDGTPSSVRKEYVSVESTPEVQSNVDIRNRTSKVAKMRYSDHGEHEQHKTESVKAPISLLKRLTYEAKGSFEAWEQAHQISHKKAVAGQQQEHGDFPSVSPHRYAFSQLALADTFNSGCNPATEATNDPLLPWGSRGMQRGSGPAVGNNKQGLAAVMEGHSESASVVADRITYPTSTPSISTKTSRTDSTNAPVDLGLTSQQHTQVQGRCLTVPADPVANDNMDNVEGNLIVFDNDVIKVPSRSIHTVNPGETGKLRSAEYRMRGALGQGTFAQVFRCLHVETGQEVAVKIVKNKPAYTRQATVEIDVFRALQEDDGVSVSSDSDEGSKSSRDYMVNLKCYFMHRSHLCLVFELLGLNLYDILKRRQFRGLPLSIVRTVVLQTVKGIRDLSKKKNIIHCDLKPENILLSSDAAVEAVVHAGEAKRPTSQQATPTRDGSETCAVDNTHGLGDPVLSPQDVKLIDFGSACFEGHTAHTYIQSRFYRSPEVLIGLPYDSSIDMWSLGCVAAELFLGLPILPGVHEHDQVGRISEMIGKLPDWMLEQGSKATKYYVKFVSRPPPSEQRVSVTPSPAHTNSVSPAPPAVPQWRLKTQEEYINSLSQNEIKKKGGLAKLQKQPGNRYFKLKRLSDILKVHGKGIVAEEKSGINAFVHFLYGLLDPDPWKRWTAFQAVQHPFITGDLSQLRNKTSEMKLDPKEENHANLELDVYWQSPWDPAVCRRKLLNVQKLREKQQAGRKGMASRSQSNEMIPPERRRVRGGEIESPAQGLRNGLDESISNYAHRRTSPPNQIAAPALGGQRPGHSIGRVRQESTGYAMSSSLSNLGQPGSYIPLAMDTGSVAGQSYRTDNDQGGMMGPQSFTNGSGYERSRAPTEGDFAYALQRPGVVPGADAASMNSHSMSWGQMQNSMHAHAAGSYSNRGPASQLQSKVNSQVGGQYGMHGPSSYGSSAAPYEGRYGTASSMQSTSVSSSVTLQDIRSQSFSIPRSSYVDPQQQGLLQQQQQFASMPQQPGGQQTPVMMQQQPVYLTSGGPDGGYYYVTTSATGQPIILQPVTMPSRPTHATGAYLPQQASIPDHQQYQFQQPNTQYQSQVPQMQQPHLHLQKQHFQQRQFQQHQQQNQQQPTVQYQQQQFEQQPNRQFHQSSGAPNSYQQQTLPKQPPSAHRNRRDRYRGGGDGGTSM